MSKRAAPQLAKLSCPRIDRIVTRQRLLDRLEHCRQRPCIWVCAPPGAGKTTLLADYSRASGMPTIWFLIDPADRDPATFFFYLREAVRARSRRRAVHLPLFTPEYRHDLGGFARRFFRDMFAFLGVPSLVVFDNFHELPRDCALHAALATCIDEVPEGTSIIVLGRDDPPPAFARAHLHERLTQLEWDEIKLTRAESANMALARGVPKDADLDELHNRCGGWIAGLVLLAEQWRQTGGLQCGWPAESMETIFDYFAGEILGAISPLGQEILVRTALLPRITPASAAAVTGIADAVAHVEQLYRRRVFADRTQGRVVSYRYHALFQSFLRDRAKSRLEEATRIELLRRAGAAFEQEDETETAFEIFIEGRDVASAQRLFVRHAPLLIAQGRWRVVGDWHVAMCAFGEPVSPWVTFWLGRSLTVVQPEEARRVLESSHSAFLGQQDERGRILSAAGVIEALYHQYEQFRDMDAWIDQVESTLSVSEACLDAEEALWVYSSLMVAYAYRRPVHGLLGKAVTVVLTLLRESADVNSKVTVATMLHYYGYTALDTQACLVATKTARPLLTSDALTAQRAALYLGEEGYSHYAFGRFREALECFDQATAITNSHHLEEVGARVIHWRGFCQRRAGQIEAAAASIRALEQISTRRSGFGLALLDLLRAYVAFERGEIERALALSEPALLACETAGQTRTQVVALIIFAGMQIEAGRFTRGEEILKQASGLSMGTVLEYQHGAITLMRAFSALRRRDFVSCGRLTRDVFVRCGDDKERSCIFWHAPIFTEILSFAVETRIDEANARRLIREAGLKPPPGASDRWPWPVKIYALGRFEIQLDGTDVAYGRKIPKRVLTLLKLLLCAGGASTEERLIDTLWPDVEGDAAHKALGALLHRLRDLLQSSEAVRQKGGRIWLDPQICWTDAGHFDRLLKGGERDIPVTFAFPDPQGPFLPEDDDIPWVAPMRERLRTRHLEFIRRNALDLEEAGHVDQAFERYRYGIEAYGNEEILMKGLERCRLRSRSGGHQDEQPRSHT